MWDGDEAPAIYKGCFRGIIRASVRAVGLAMAEMHSTERGPLCLVFVFALLFQLCDLFPGLGRGSTWRTHAESKQFQGAAGRAETPLASGQGESDLEESSRALLIQTFSSLS